MASQLKLERRLDTAHAEELAGSLKGLQGQDIAIDASDVDLLGAQCLELLLSTVSLAQVAGQSVSLVSPSDDFVANLAHFGLAPGDLETEAAA